MRAKLEFNLGRDALKYLVQYYGIKKMHVPYYLCDIVRHTLFDAGCKPVFYHIDDDFFPQKSFSEDDFVLYPNYWGICEVNVNKLVNLYPKLIIDNAHAFYNEPKGLACFSAGHKFGFKSSYLWLRERKNFETKTDIVQDKAEERKQIFIDLHNKYKNINNLKIDINSKSPFCYPCLTDTIKEADDLVKLLKEEGKTVYRYWSPLPKSFSEYKFYSRLVPIPVLPLS